MPRSGTLSGSANPTIREIVMRLLPGPDTARRFTNNLSVVKKCRNGAAHVESFDRAALAEFRALLFEVACSAALLSWAARLRS